MELSHLLTEHDDRPCFGETVNDLRPYLFSLFYKLWRLKIMSSLSLRGTLISSSVGGGGPTLKLLSFPFQLWLRWESLLWAAGGACLSPTTSQGQWGHQEFGDWNQWLKYTILCIRLMIREKIPLLVDQYDKWVNQKMALKVCNHILKQGERGFQRLKADEWGECWNS